jgi:hypothetical protein
MMLFNCPIITFETSKILLRWRFLIISQSL